MGFACSDNTIIVTSIEAMKKLVVARGGYVHPAACIQERDGSLRVVCDAPLAAGQPLFKIPDELLVPVDDLCWTDSDETMQLAGPPSDLSSDRAEMLDLFIAIYNACGKLGWNQMQAASVLLQDAELAAQLELIRPAYIVNPTPPAAHFMETRYYSSKDAQAGMAGKNCLMPLVDFTNHHIDGSPFHHGTGSMQVDINYPQNSDECFTHYGNRRDPLSLALGHGYIDPQSPFAQSVPMIVDLAGFGRIEIMGKRMAAKFKADLPKVEFSEDGLTLSHLLGDVRSPQHLSNALRLTMMASGKRRGIAEAAIDRALAELPAAILAANKEKLTAFRAYLATRPELKLASLLQEACICQMANLEKIFAG